MSDRPKPHLFTIGPERPFLDDLADGIAARVRADGGADDLLALARATVLLPTRRACQGLADAFLRRTAGAPTVLPRLLALGGAEDDEAVLLEDGDGLGGAAGDLPPAIAPLRRQLLLARLVAHWEPGDSPDHAMRLAGALARWLDQVQTAEADSGTLASLVPDALADHWRQTVEFLHIVTEHWPAILAAEGAVDPADRRNRLLMARAQAWQRHPPDGLVIAAGSTGSVPATAALLEVIAGLPKGMVVLPALDRHLEPAAWAAVLDDPAHPQHGLALLLQRLGSDADQVEAWATDHPVAAPALHDRAWLLSQAMRPAAVADRWPRMAADADRVRGALDGLQRIDCPAPEEEAGVIAVLMREALQTPERTAALVTPDRGLARRVAAALRRWGIEIDDSAGVPLAETPTGVFLRLLAEACADDLAPLPLLGLLKHPLAAGGRAPGAFRADARLLDRRLLRGPRPAPGLAGLRARLEAADRET
ncbi:MAG: double-strand break repair protein AddB, partial [Alphaproteobacteria bacterium]|nr:double-strand break repair protein AddB [Alphaproteobacteria bacterium]